MGAHGRSAQGRAHLRQLAAGHRATFLQTEQEVGHREDKGTAIVHTSAVRQSGHVSI